MFGVGVRLKQDPELNFFKKNLDETVRTYSLHKKFTTNKKINQ